MKHLACALAAAAMTIAAPAFAQQSAPKPTTLFTNVNIFDGKSDTLADGMSVLVEGNKIAKIAKSINAPSGGTSIDGKGRTLMPGIIGCHEHVMMQLPITTLLNADERYIAAVATSTVKTYLMSGWTSVRDASGDLPG